MGSSRAEPSLRRIQHPVRLGLAVVVSAILLVGAFVAGQLTAPPDREALAVAQEKIIATAEVEWRVIDSRATYPAQVVEATTKPVLIPQAAGGVVVENRVKPGASLAAGSLIMVISGEPYFALSGPLALYRDLKIGDKGPDVRLLQEAFVRAGFDVSTEGEVGPVTFSIARQIYESAGFAAPSETIPYTAFVALDVDAKAMSTIAVGSTVEPDTAVLSLEGKPPTAEIRVNAVEATSMNVGDVVSGRVDGTTTTFAIQEIGEFIAAADGEPGGRTVTLAPTDPDVALAAGAAVTIYGAGEQDASLAVPLVAIREDSQGTFLLRQQQSEPPSAGNEYVRIDVTVTRSGDGWAAIAEGNVMEGDKVQVSG